ncbi:MAG: aldo/keto reductase [Opitutus sp.]|nr:aldo/keto reductase [Opitutus sp.]
MDTFSSPAEGLAATTTLNNGVKMPWMGAGVWQINSDDETSRVVQAAIAAGYRRIDTASLYGNERGVGEGIRQSGVARDQIFVTTKVWNDDMRTGRIEEALEKSLQKLGFDYVDLYLLHWPVSGKIIPAWQALERLYREGRVRAIGVSNFMIPHLEDLLSSTRVVPAVNQIEFHPYLQSRALLNYCRGKNIQLEAWSPLMQGGPLLQNPVLEDIARAHGKTPAQIILRWDLQMGVATIPKSARAERLAANANVFDFTLSEAEMRAIAGLDRGQRAGPDPFNFNF